MKRSYALAGIALLVIGLMVAMTFSTVAETFGPEKTILTFDQPFDYHGVPVKKGTEIVVNFNTERQGSEVSAILVPEENFNEATAKMKDSPWLAYVFSAAAEQATYKLDYAQRSQGKLSWTATEDGTYFVIFSTPAKMVTKPFEQTITKDVGYSYSKLSLKAGSIVGVGFKCGDDDDAVRAVLMSAANYDRFQAGETTPSDQLLADAVGNSGSLLWVSPTDGDYYLIIKPTAGHWPVPISVSLDTSFIQEGSEWPLTLTYTMEGIHSGPGYIGLPILVAGIVVLTLGFMKKPKALQPTLQPTQPAPQPSIPSSKFCANCGIEAKPDTTYCVNCGTRIQ